MAQQLGGTVEGGHHREFGRADLEVTDDCALFDGVWQKGGTYEVWMSHGDRVTKLPDGFRGVAKARGLADLRHRRRHAQVLRHAVPPRGGAHARRRQADPQLRAQHRRPLRRLDHARLPRGGDQEDPRPGRQGQGDLRPLRRRRFRGRRGADPRGDRRPAHLRVRRPRPAQAERGRDRRRPVPAPLQHPAGACGRLEDVPRRARRRQRSRDQAQDHRQALHRRVRGRRRRRSAAPTSWRRARSIPT